MRKHEILSSGAFYVKRIRTFSNATSKIKKKLNLDFFVSFNSVFQNFSN